MAAKAFMNYETYGTSRANGYKILEDMAEIVKTMHQNQVTKMVT